jgi:hypothetical protein
MILLPFHALIQAYFNIKYPFFVLQQFLLPLDPAIGINDVPRKRSTNDPKTSWMLEVLSSTMVHITTLF